MPEKEPQYFKEFRKYLDERLTTIENTLEEHTCLLNSHADEIGKLMIKTTRIEDKLDGKAKQSDVDEIEERVVDLEKEVFA